MNITILGGGPGGLSAAFYAARAGLPIDLYEKRDRIGGTARTLRYKNFALDSGAHRFHDVHADITADIRGLLRGDLVRIDAPSQIYSEGKFFNFPLTMINLFKNMGLGQILHAAWDLIHSRMSAGGSTGENFGDYACSRYGSFVAERFLLRYSEKLWGDECRNLSADISGKRLKGLGLRSALLEALLSRRKNIEHLDGAFYYPGKGGIGAICDALGEAGGLENIQTGAEITKIFHAPGLVHALEVKGSRKLPVERVVSTLPLSDLIAGLDPPAPHRVRQASRGLRFRSLVLVLLCLDRPAVSPNASIYFPGREVPFTRIFEPRNRNPLLAPAGQTSLVAELPCWRGDDVWTGEERTLVEGVVKPLTHCGLIRREEIFDTAIFRLVNTYPVLDVSYRKRLDIIGDYLAGFGNLHLLGRNSQFQYLHIHDLLKSAKNKIEALVSPGEGRAHIPPNRVEA